MSLILKLITAIIAVLFAVSITTAQEVQTMYVMKNNAILFQSSVSEIDSIIFYEPDNPRIAGGVEINGVVWATRNVGFPGTFVENPEETGVFYKWNRNTAWPGINPESNTWVKANDPSPVGWRVPTLAEIQSLLDTDKVTNEWTTINGVGGRRFTDRMSGNSIFLPATGYRHNFSEMFFYANPFGYYWSSTRNSSHRAHYLHFGSDQAVWFFEEIGHGFNIRSVAE